MTAVGIVIADEVLNGSVKDKNVGFLADTLFAHGVQLKRVEIIEDDLDDIAETVRKYSDKVDYVFTTGGIGSTHDDVTYAAIAKAFGRKLELHEPSLRKMEVYMKEKNSVVNDARKLMVTLPTPCEIIETDGLWVPLCVVENVHIFPGVPSLFQRMLLGMTDRLDGRVLTKVNVFTRMYECDLSDMLSGVAREHPDVKIGSYPKLSDSGANYTVRLSFMGHDADKVGAVAEHVRAHVEGWTEDMRDVVHG